MQERRRKLSSFREAVLTCLTWSRSLDEFADGLYSSIESIDPGTVVALYGVGANTRLFPAGRPRLPTEYQELSRQVAVGEGAGPCGTAAYRGQPVLACDVPGDELWQALARAGIPTELHACWCAPIVNVDGATVGVLAFYYAETTGPQDVDLVMVDLCAELCLLALEREGLITQLADVFRTDPVTRLPTRACFDDEVARDASFAAGAVIAIGVDNLAVLHRALGARASDTVLIELTKRFRRELIKVPGARIYRTEDGGFLSKLPSISEEIATILAGRILAVADHPVTADNLSVRATLSVGVGLAPSHGRDLRSLRHAAELALSQAQEDGGSRVAYFDKHLGAASSERFSLGAALDGAIRTEELTVVFQPQINLHDDTLAGVEALARWRRAPAIPPWRFVEVAEQNGLVGELDRLIFKLACRQLRTWRDQDLPVPRLSVNWSAHTLTDPAIVDFADRVVGRYGLDPAELTLELTETALIDDTAAWSTALELHDLGFRLSVDDFGTGYSSLSRLSKLPFGELKIDRSLLTDRAADPRMDAVITAAIRLGQALGVDVVAEGTEQESDVEFLRAHGAVVAQGYLFAPPLPAPDLERFLKETGRG